MSAKTFRAYLEGKNQDDLAMVVDHLKAFLEERYGTTVSFKNETSYSLDLTTLQRYKDAVKQLKNGDESIVKDAKEGLLFSTAYLDFSNNGKIKYAWYPFFYIVRPLTGAGDVRMIFTSREDILGDWAKTGKVCENTQALIDAFIAHVDDKLDTLVQRFTQPDFAHA